MLENDNAMNVQNLSEKSSMSLMACDGPMLFIDSQSPPLSNHLLKPVEKVIKI